ncbi:MAG: hypothetical protein ACKO8I_05745 [Cyanobacteriota bacterium]
MIACETGLSRGSLYKAASDDRSPCLDAVLMAISTLDLQLCESVKAGDIVKEVA